jgi:hypothetical protein
LLLGRRVLHVIKIAPVIACPVLAPPAQTSPTSEISPLSTTEVPTTTAAG